MESTFSRNKDSSYDRLVWFFLMLFLSMLSLLMLTRDSQKQYGAMSFGVFPEFSAIDSQKKTFDQHRLRGQVSAIIITNQILPDDITFYLHKLFQATARGKKYLNGLVLTQQAKGMSDQRVQYLTLSEKEYQKLNDCQEGKFKGSVILVDQNGVIRGIFDLRDKTQRLNFEGAVRGIL